MKRILSIAILLVGLVSVIAVPVAANDKVDICHRTGNGEVHLISLSENALAAHQAHGHYTTPTTIGC
jgi:hypothetical protein